LLQLTHAIKQQSPYYRASLEKNKEEKDVLNFKMGYSHNLKYIVPYSIRAFLLEPTLIKVFIFPEKLAIFLKDNYFIRKQIKGDI